MITFRVRNDLLYMGVSVVFLISTAELLVMRNEFRCYFWIRPTFPIFSN